MRIVNFLLAYTSDSEARIYPVSSSWLQTCLNCRVESLGVGTPLLCKIIWAWTSGPLLTAVITSMAALACAPDKASLFVWAALNLLPAE